MIEILEEDDGDMNCVGTARCSCNPETFEFNVKSEQNVKTSRGPDRRFISVVVCPRCGSVEDSE